MYRNYIKRIFDIILSIILIPFIFLVIVPVAIFIKAEDGGSIFYRSRRVGKDFKEFDMFKLRSMKLNAEDIRNADGSTFNSSNDPRVTKIGKFIRKTSLDELPQILNVLLGDMSFIGPRPSPTGNMHRYSEEFKKKFRVQPGITGLNQATARNSATMEVRTQNDVYYTEHLSFLLDLKIILLTIKSVLLRKNINRN